MAYNAIQQREEYYRDLNLSRAKGRICSARFRQLNREVVQNYKATHSCVICGESDPIVLEFHHRDRTTKKFTIGDQIARKSRQAIIEEIAKCDILCANCHRRTTALNKDYNPTRDKE